jgi:HSP20 family molecular chaperone IbpA
LAYGDPFEEVDFILKRLMRRMEEFRRMVEESFLAEEELFERRIRELSEGETEPLISVNDFGDRFVIIVDMPGVEGSSVEIKFEDNGRKLIVEGSLNQEVAREALGDAIWASRVSRFRGVYTLPEPVDLHRISVERRGSTVIIIAPKKS